MFYFTYPFNVIFKNLKLWILKICLYCCLYMHKWMILILYNILNLLINFEIEISINSYHLTSTTPHKKLNSTNPKNVYCNLWIIWIFLIIIAFLIISIHYSHSQLIQYSFKNFFDSLYLVFFWNYYTISISWTSSILLFALIL